MKIEKEIKQHPKCKKYRTGFLSDLGIIRSWIIGSTVYTFVNRLNPLTWVFFVVFIFLAPIFCLFENTTLQEQYGILLKIIFKGEV